MFDLENMYCKSPFSLLRSVLRIGEFYFAKLKAKFTANFALSIKNLKQFALTYKNRLARKK